MEQPNNLSDDVSSDYISSDDSDYSDDSNDSDECENNKNNMLDEQHIFNKSDEFIKPNKSNQELIMEIHRDKNLTGDEKRKKINEIMLGKYKSTEEIKIPECFHYKKLCDKFYFSCCNKYYDCCKCHNQKETCGNEIKIESINCVKCNNRQDPSEKCKYCDIKFSRSFCKICNIWSEKFIYHCEKCTICRIGTADKLFHCDNCQACIKKSKTPGEIEHVCKSNLSKTIDCSLCLENSKTSQNKLMVLDCNHVVHHECLVVSLENNNYKCPCCRKSMIKMDMFWRNVDMQIMLHPLPEEIKKKVNIICYDCCENSDQVDWHILGIKCIKCNSYNTSTR